MIVYVEGPAGAGKSSFVKRAHELCPDDYLIFDEYSLDEDTETRKSYQTFLTNTEAKIKEIRKQKDDSPVLLVDRGHLSMLINAFVEQHHGLNETFDQAYAWYGEYRKSPDFLLPDLYVYIDAPVDTIISRATDGGWYRDDLGWTIDPELSMEAYEQFFEKIEPEVPILRLDGSKPSEYIVNQFLEYIDSKKVL